MLFINNVKILIKAWIISTAILVFDLRMAEGNELPAIPGESNNPSVVINESQQNSAGILTMVLNPIQHQPEYEAMGKVVSIQPLLALRERYLSAQAELEGAKARQKLAALNLNRQKNLYDSGVSPMRSLQNQEAQGINDQAAVTTAQAKLATIQNEATLNWGNTLSKWALTAKTSHLKEFLLAKQQLLQITLPANKQLAKEQESIMVATSGERTKAQVASLISKTMLVDNTRQGISYYFKTGASDLSIGMKVTAWISEPDSEQTGFIIPESALIWYLDQTFVYCKTGKEKFSRHLVKNISAANDGYFVTEGVASGDEIVTTGGQLLLSEELKNQIPDED
ncbi:hypothetical protein MCAMS1_00560 [biofilm metagenome]